MTPFRERNPVAVGAVGVVLIALFLALALQAKNLPVIGGGTTYYADFTEVGGLQKGDDVRLAGVRIGEVEGLELDDAKVHVKMRVEDETDKLHTETGASIRIKTLLGTMYVALEPSGSGQMDDGTTIPESRTVPPYDIVEAFTDLATTTQQIDTDQLAYAMKTLSDVGENTPKAFRGTIDGLTRLATNLTKKDDQINDLLDNVDNLTGVLNSRNTQLVSLFKDGQVLFDALTQRRQAIHDILVATTNMSNELHALVVQTRGNLKPALDQLAGVVKVLKQNESSIDAALARLPEYYRGVTDATGSGPWIDSFAYNLLSLLGFGDGAL